MPDSERRDVIVIGGSAGAIEGVMSIVRALPAQLPAAIGIVVHQSEHTPNVFGSILERLRTLLVVTVDGEVPLEWGKIYLPTPDRHLLLGPDRVFTTRTAKENHARPAIDPLFRSAARAHGRRVIGVVLSGNLDDGTAGLAAIRRQGGMTVVQDPKDARFTGMPSSAVGAMRIDHVVPLAAIPGLLVRTVADDLPAVAGGAHHVPHRPAVGRERPRPEVASLRRLRDMG